MTSEKNIQFFVMRLLKNEAVFQNVGHSFVG